MVSRPAGARCHDQRKRSGLRCTGLPPRVAQAFVPQGDAVGLRAKGPAVTSQQLVATLRRWQAISSGRRCRRRSIWLRQTGGRRTPSSRAYGSTIGQVRAPGRRWQRVACCAPESVPLRQGRRRRPGSLTTTRGRLGVVQSTAAWSHQSGTPRSSAQHRPGRAVSGPGRRRRTGVSGPAIARTPQPGRNPASPLCVSAAVRR